jgi:hypothetical protein
MFKTEKKLDESDFEENALIMKENEILFNKYINPLILEPYSNQILSNYNSTIFLSIEDVKYIFNNSYIQNEEENQINSTPNSSVPSIFHFDVKVYKERGPKSLGKKRKTESLDKKVMPESSSKKRKHLSHDFDNIQRKIQVHYLTFIVNLCNDAIKAVYGNNNQYSFKQIDYEIKKIINHKFVNELHSLTIKELLKKKISPKIKNYSESINITTLDKVCKESTFLDKLFSKKYLEFFNEYYFNEDKLINNIILDGIEIVFSENTKPFYSLIKKYEAYNNKIIEIAKIIYFSGYNSLIGTNSFKTKKNAKCEIVLKE